MNKKDVGIAYILLILLGVLGIHKFYLGKIGIGILYLLTFGGFLIGVFIDLFTLPHQVRVANMLNEQMTPNITVNLSDYKK